MRRYRIYQGMLSLILGLLVLIGSPGFLVTYDVCDQCGIHALAVSGVVSVEKEVCHGHDHSHNEHLPAPTSKNPSFTAPALYLASCSLVHAVNCQHHKETLQVKLPDQEQAGSSQILLEPGCIETGFQVAVPRPGQISYTSTRNTIIPYTSIYQQHCRLLL